MKPDPEYVRRRLERLAAVEAELADPATLASSRKYQALTIEHAALRDLDRQAREWFRVTKELAEAREMAAASATDAEMRDLAQAELPALEAALAQAETELLGALLPPDPQDSRNTIMEIRAGTGGDEACLFAGDLLRMYTRYAEGRGWKLEIIDASGGEMGGFKEVICSVEGRNVYRLLKYESGGHRVQRVPSTEGSGRIHTSAATVAVLPEADEMDHVDIQPEDLRIETMRAGGAGGQHVNKTESAVRITHIASGLVVICRDERSQQRNRDRAMKVLRARLLDKLRGAEHARQASERKLQIGSGDRSERIRTYNFPQNRLTDHRINLTLYSLDRIMEGDLTPVVDALLARDTELRLEAQMQANAG